MASVPIVVADEVVIVHGHEHVGPLLGGHQVADVAAIVGIVGDQGFIGETVEISSCSARSDDTVVSKPLMRRLADRSATASCGVFLSPMMRALDFFEDARTAQNSRHIPQQAGTLIVVITRVIRGQAMTIRLPEMIGSVRQIMSSVLTRGSKT